MYLDVPGIYQIKNLATEDIYVGSSENLRKRRNRHYSDLKYNGHYNIHLQRAYNKYGKELFIFLPILICEKEFLEEGEQKIINIFKPRYNIRPDATSNLGVKRSDEYRKKVGDFFRGKSLSKEHIKARDLSMCINNFNNNPTAGIRVSRDRFYPYFRKKYLGTFTSLEDARNIYKKAVYTYYGVEDGVLFT